MSEVVTNSPQEFWRPPVASLPNAPTGAVGTCARCGVEFMVAANFCHACGADRLAQSALPSENWTAWFRFLKVLEFQSLQEWLGLSVASFIAFFAGLGCILAAIAVGLIYSAQNLADFQAIQLWRMQWLLGAIVAFVAGILLRQAGTSKS